MEKAIKPFLSSSAYQFLLYSASSRSTRSSIPWKISASVDGSQRFLLVWLGKSAARPFPTPEQQSRHFRTTWVRWAPRFQRRQSAAHCTKKGCMGVVPERPLSSLTGIAKLNLHLPESTETRIKASGHQFYGQTRRKWSCLVTGMFPSFGTRKVKHSTQRTLCRLWNLEVGASCCGVVSVQVGPVIL